ncbi:MAG: DUF4422 domain-containing protein [Akkermansiaceae bacterium]|nr:DUF4422 domain-containing protein [Akkermansiaceae bacterium]
MHCNTSLKPSIKILITQKKYSKLLSSDIFTPIQTGAAISDVRFDDMMHDDDGENISEKNDYFCELTAIYWAWKNYDKLGNPEYIGFMHNRRHFIFNEREYKKNKWGLVEFENLDEEYLDACSLRDEVVYSAVGGYDAILPETVNVDLTVREQYKKHHFEQDLDIALRILREKQPAYSRLAEKYSNSKDAYYLLMGIYKREIFFRYCEWLFGLIFEIFGHIDYTGYTAQQARVCGYLAERLSGIFFLKLAEEGKRLRHLKVTLLTNADSLYIRYSSEPRPVFESEDTCVIAMTSSNEYVPYLSTAIESICRHASSERNYDIIVFERDISDINKSILQRNYSKGNCSVRFYHIGDRLKNTALFLPLKHVREESYFRLLIPSVLNSYSKVLYLDSDIILRDDVYNLFSIELGAHPIAGVKDWVYSALVNTSETFRRYSIETLKLDSPYDYYNAGVLLMNVAYMRTHNCTQDLLTLAQNEYCFMDQCVLNTYFRGQILELPAEWNYFAEGENWGNLWDSVPLQQIYQAKAARTAPKLIHYAGPCKPWLNRYVEFADIYMRYAKESPYFTDILKNKWEDTIGSHIEDSIITRMSSQYVGEHRIRYFFRYLFYCFKYALFRREKYRVKKRRLRQQLREARQWVKQLYKR